MKQQCWRFRVIAFLLVLGLLLAGGYGVYSVSTYGSRWFANRYNTRYRAAKKVVIPGDVLDRNGVVLAGVDEAGNRTYHPDQTIRSAMVHVIGDPKGNVANAVDTFQASYLWGFKTSVGERIGTLLSGEQRRGDHVTLTVDSALQGRIATAFSTLPSTAGKAGAVVVMNYRTGEVLALLSVPNFDPVGDLDAIREHPQRPFWNRALQDLQAPGSTFKIVTAASVLKYLPDATTRLFDCTTGVTQIKKQNITDPGDAHYGYITDSGDVHHGYVTLADAFRVSCNNSFAQAALHLGDQNLRRTAEAFGFNDNFLFRDLVVENSVYPTEDRNDLEVAWSGVGQSRVLATPMHMCMVAAAIANDGVMMEPRLLLRVNSPAGALRLGFTSKPYRTVCTPEVAAVLDGYMKAVVEDGTGRSAAVEGLTVAGKTGSAESSIDSSKVTHAWFVGYLDEPDAPYAVCVFVQNGGFGGAVAAPLAKQIFAWLTE